MFDLVLLSLKFVFLFLLYLFLFLLVRLVYKDMASSGQSSRPRIEMELETPRPRLIVLETPQGEVGRTFPLPDKAVIGRSSRSDVPVEDAFVSTSHARISKQDNYFILEDLGSTNGTFLEGEKISKPLPLKTGNKIKVGETLLEFIQ